jgi:hypothetical protein
MRLNASVLPIAAALALTAGCKDSGDTTPPTRTRDAATGSASPSRSSDPFGSARSAQDKSARDRTGTGDSSRTPAGAGVQQSVTGTVAQVSADEVQVDTANQPGLKLKVNNSTRITVDGKDASASELREGTQVRASYQGTGDQATAIRIEARSSRSGSEEQLPGMRGPSDATGIPSSRGSGTKPPGGK